MGSHLDRCPGTVKQLGERVYHAGCFRCVECSMELNAKVCAAAASPCDSNGMLPQFCIKDEEIYCKKDFDERFGLKCYACHELLEGKFKARVIAKLAWVDNWVAPTQNAFGRFYHNKCFVCFKCKQILKESALAHVQFRR